MDLPIYRQTKSSIPIVLDEMRPDESETVRTLFNQIVLEGNSYPQSNPLSVEAFANYWLKGDAFVVRCLSKEQVLDVSNLVAAFYIKPNFPGRCSHICNAGFIVAPEMRGQGLGRLMGEVMLELAKERGYRAVMYNLVFETNIASLKIWKSMGFQELGRIPEGAYLADDRYVDAVMLYKSLV
ncbi:GNAT family N-acetyltransferase [Oscillatoria sp. CS-180]|uniref:GNAT family N-acetyltransferase n=1 Tax=Oscillatoria sp. CS-180 TaxID=3021720 RepID=UPI00232B0A89|nr:GNAT family N-acetyltransferase [Oscillatoria sp. CS-180]MDB9528268.1 GNAT family N-acetyltransferase [Oscillatoria sp. CS-180]